MKRSSAQKNKPSRDTKTVRNVIDAKGITRTFITGEIETHALKGIDLSVKEGEYIAIVGKSGAGKSTLLYQLAVLDEPTSGSLIIDGVDVSTLSEREQTEFRLYTLGFVFQDYALVPDLSASENVMMPLLMRGEDWNIAKQEANDALDAVGLANKYTNLPSQLSGGEQQRVAIARALAGTPHILFADEPTANLDSVSGKQIIDLLGELHRTYNLTIVMVTHEDEYTKDVNRIVTIEDGCVVSDEPKPKRRVVKTKKKTTRRQRSADKK